MRMVGGLVLIAPEACTQILRQKSPRAHHSLALVGVVGTDDLRRPGQPLRARSPANLDPDARPGLDVAHLV